MTDFHTTHSVRRMRRWFGIALFACLMSASPSLAFVFGEPLPTLPPLVGNGSNEPSSNPENPPGGSGTPGSEEPVPGPTDLPPVIGGENPPPGNGENPPGGGIVDDTPPSVPTNVQSTPEPATLAMGLIGAGIAAIASRRRRKK